MKSAAPHRVADLCALLSINAPKENADQLITGVSTLAAATESDLSFVTKEKFHKEALTSKAGVLLVPCDFPSSDPRFLPVDNVMESLLLLLEHLNPPPPREGFIHPSAVVSSGAQIAPDAHIGACVVIESDAVIEARVRIESGSYIGPNVRVGEESWPSPNVTLLSDTQLGRRVRIHSGSVLGADGFRYEVVGRQLRKIPQLGRVVVEDDVEIGAVCTIDRAFLEETRIGARTKLDNHVHLGHNVTVGSDCIIVGQVGVGGSARIGRGVMIGGAAVIKDHITIGDGARIGGRSGVQSNVAPGAQVIGTPSVDVKTYARFTTFYRNFSGVSGKLRELLAGDDKKTDGE